MYIANKKLTTRFPTSYRWNPYVTPKINSPKGGSKSEFVVFVNTNQFKSNKLYSKFLCMKTCSRKVVVKPFPYLTVYRCWWYALSVMIIQNGHIKQNTKTERIPQDLGKSCNDELSEDWDDVRELRKTVDDMTDHATTVLRNVLHRLKDYTRCLNKNVPLYFIL